MILGGRSSCGTQSGYLRNRRSRQSAAFLRTKLRLLPEISSCLASTASDSANSCPPMLATKASASDWKISLLGCRSFLMVCTSSLRNSVFSFHSS